MGVVVVVVVVRRLLMRLRLKCRAGGRRGCLCRLDYLVRKSCHGRNQESNFQRYLIGKTLKADVTSNDYIAGNGSF